MHRKTPNTTGNTEGILEGRCLFLHLTFEHLVWLYWFVAPSGSALGIKYVSKYLKYHNRYLMSSTDQAITIQICTNKMRPFCQLRTCHPDSASAQYIRCFFVFSDFLLLQKHYQSTLSWFKLVLVHSNKHNSFTRSCKHYPGTGV